MCAEALLKCLILNEDKNIFGVGAAKKFVMVLLLVQLRGQEAERLFVAWPVPLPLLSKHFHAARNICRHLYKEISSF